MSEPLAREWLDEAKRASDEFQNHFILLECVDGEAFVETERAMYTAALEAAELMPALLNALRWRAVGDEPPANEARVLMIEPTSMDDPEICVIRNGVWRDEEGRCFRMTPDDRWLPIPPR